MKFSTFVSNLTRIRPFTPPVYDYAAESDTSKSFMPARKLHFYVNTNRHNLDLIDLDNDNDERVNTIAVINKRHVHDFTINDNFWILVPQDRQAGVLMNIVQLASTPISQREELDSDLAKALSEADHDDFIKDVNDYLNALELLSKGSDNIDAATEPDTDSDDDADNDTDTKYYEDNDDAFCPVANDNYDELDDDNDEAPSANIVNDTDTEPSSKPASPTQLALDALKASSDTEPETLAASLRQVASNSRPTHVESIIWCEIVRKLQQVAQHQYNTYTVIFDNLLHELDTSHKLIVDDTVTNLIHTDADQLAAYLQTKCEDDELSSTITCDANGKTIGITIKW